jgi:hypothetical protein
MQTSQGRRQVCRVAIGAGRWSGSYGTVGSLSSSMSIPVEGGASTVTQLPASQFDLTVP